MQRRRVTIDVRAIRMVVTCAL